MKKIYLLFVTLVAFCELTNAQWNYAGTAFIGFVRGIYFLNEDTGFAAGGDGSTTGYIAKTIDGGVNWTSTSFTQSNLLRSIDFVNNDTGYVSGAAGVLLQTTDGGATWSTLYTNSLQYFRAVDFVS